MLGTSWIEPVIGAVLTAIVVVIIRRRSGKLPDLRNGLLHFRLPRVFVIIGGVSFLLALLFAWGMVEVDTWALTLFLGFMMAAFMWMGVILMRDGFHYKVACNEEVLVVITGGQRFDTCLWTDLISGTVHPLSKFILLRSRDGRTFKINAYLIGSASLFSIMAEKTQLPVAELVAKATAV